MEGWTRSWWKNGYLELDLKSRNLVGMSAFKTPSVNSLLVPVGISHDFRHRRPLRRIEVRHLQY
jgi:hypothetical protein